MSSAPCLSSFAHRAVIPGFVAIGFGAAAPTYAMQPGELLIWFSVYGRPGMQQIADRFEKDTGVRVVVEGVTDGPQKFTQAASVSKGPDIFIFAHDRIGEWIGGGLIRPVTPSRRILADIDPLAWKAFTVNGRNWGYPLTMESASLVYNTALVKTPPRTFEELFSLDQALAKDGRKAILWDYTNTYFTWSMMAAGGAYSFKPTANGGYDVADVGVGNDGALKGATLLKRMLDEKLMPAGSGYSEMEAAMAKGKVAMMINGPWSWDNLEKAGVKYAVARIPSVDGKPSAPFIGVRGVMINRASPNKEIAAEFIENYLLTLDGLRKINAAEAIGVPASKSFYEELRADPRIAAAMESIKDGVITPNNPEMGKFWAAMKSSLSNLSEGRQSPREALDAAARRIAQP